METERSFESPQENKQPVSADSSRELSLRRAEMATEEVRRLRADIMQHALRFMGVAAQLKRERGDVPKSYFTEQQQALLASEETAREILEEATELGHRMYRVEDLLRAGEDVDPEERVLLKERRARLEESNVWLKQAAKQVDWDSFRRAPQEPVSPKYVLPPVPKSEEVTRPAAKRRNSEPVPEETADEVEITVEKRLSPEERLTVLRDLLAQDRAFLKKYDLLRMEEAGLRRQIELVTQEMKSAPYEGGSEELIELHASQEERLLALHQRTQLLHGLAKETQTRVQVVTDLIAKLEAKKRLGEGDMEPLVGALLEKVETYLNEREKPGMEKMAGLYARLAEEIQELPEEIREEDPGFEYKEIPRLRVPEALVREQIIAEKARIERRLAFLRDQARAMTGRMALADEKTRRELKGLLQDIEDALPINESMMQELQMLETALEREEMMKLSLVEALRRVEEAVLRKQVEEQIGPSASSG